MFEMKKINQGLMTSNTDEWATPQEFFDRLNALYGPFTTDVCADESNAKCRSYFDKATDGLKQTWAGKCWMNPPYGREIGKWMKKAYESASAGAVVVCLVPARTDTKWWHDYAAKGQVTFIQGRLKFGGSKNSAPFPSAVVVFRQPQPEQEPVAWVGPSWLNPETRTWESESFSPKPIKGWIPLYTAPRQWQGLTDDEIVLICGECAASHADDLRYARAIEAKLRERNT